MFGPCQFKALKAANLELMPRSCLANSMVQRVRVKDYQRRRQMNSLFNHAFINDLDMRRAAQRPSDKSLQRSKQQQHDSRT